MQHLKIIMVISMLFAYNLSLVYASEWKQDEFIITFWCPPPTTKQRLSLVAKQGFNLTWTYEDGLSVIRDQGLKAILQDNLLTTSTLDDPVQRAKLDALIDRVKIDPSLEAYFLADEPSTSDFPALGRLVAYLRERDPNHFAYINLYPIYATNKQLGTNGPRDKAYHEYLWRYIDEVNPSLISFDHYHFLKNGDGDQYFHNLEIIRQAALVHGLPFLNIIQASTIDKSWRLVNPRELRWLVYTTLAYGGRGLCYFLYWGPLDYGGLYQSGVRTPLVDTVTILNKELFYLGPLLMDLANVGTYHTTPLPIGTKPVPMSSPVQFVGSGSFVLGLFGNNHKITAFMVVNRDYKNQVMAQMVFRTDVKGIEEFDRTSNAWITSKSPISKHGVSVTIGPGDGKLFRFVPKLH